MRTSILVALLAVVGIVFSPTPASAGIAPGPGEGKIDIGTSIRARPLSNEVSVTRFAFALRTTAIRHSPNPGSRTKGRLKRLTSDDKALPYLALSSQTESPGRTWIKIRIPAHPNGRIGWVPGNALGSLRTTFGRLVVNRKSLRATLYGRRGQVRWRAPVGDGKPGLSTPGGHFWITERLGSIGGSAYGPVAFGTSAYAAHLTDWPGGRAIGIHGTDEPGLIPGRRSRGSILLRNRDIRTLNRKLKIGTPLRIR